MIVAGAERALGETLVMTDNDGVDDVPDEVVF